MTSRMEEMDLHDILREGMVPFKARYIWDFPMAFSKETGEEHALFENDEMFWVEPLDRWVLWPVYALFKRAKSCMLHRTQLEQIAEQLRPDDALDLIETFVLKLVDTALTEMDSDDDFEYLVLGVGMTGSDRRRTALEIIPKVPKPPI